MLIKINEVYTPYINPSFKEIFVFFCLLFYLREQVTRFNKFHAKKLNQNPFEHRGCVPLENLETLGRVTLKLPEFAYI